MPEKSEIFQNLKQLDQEFFARSSTEVAPDLLGKTIVSVKNGELTAGIITETEAYPGSDAASHVFGRQQPTQRTQAQYESAGHLYMYLIMGLHTMTSIVTNEIGTPDVVFIRSIEPIEGLSIMRERRNYAKEKLKGLASGPGRLSQALALTVEDDGIPVFAEDSNIRIFESIVDQPIEIDQGLRINLGTHGAGEEESLLAINQPWRYFIKSSEFLST